MIFSGIYMSTTFCVDAPLKKSQQLTIQKPEASYLMQVLTYGAGHPIANSYVIWQGEIK